MSSFASSSLISWILLSFFSFFSILGNGLHYWIPDSCESGWHHFSSESSISLVNHSNGFHCFFKPLVLSEFHVCKSVSDGSVPQSESCHSYRLKNNRSFHFCEPESGFGDSSFDAVAQISSPIDLSFCRLDPIKKAWGKVNFHFQKNDFSLWHWQHSLEESFLSVAHCSLKHANDCPVCHFCSINHGILPFYSDCSTDISIFAKTFFSNEIYLTNLVSSYFSRAPPFPAEKLLSLELIRK
ncbi:MAG: hypothetical protein Q4C95_10000 [Planctomycetia bacterium]|nr:hypothetical protein [Planctomycetia bacterium]